MRKPHVTRTLGPIHFEDLDPKRFEDLIRELIYDYKDWQSIEATGRGGSDEGFDIRAYEKISGYYDIGSTSEEDSNEEIVTLHPMDGNLWMIQCKREIEIGPQRVSEIIKENIKPKSPPYGYILVASANFSKKSYDIFREELKQLGVMEFYLWGKAELEDMLHMPKYDRILFTFFGLSLVSKRRSRTTEIRSIITIKNKLYKLLGDPEIHHNVPILIRDINDTKYPYKEEYPDFGTKPRWGVYTFAENHVRGILIEIKKHYGYWDLRKNEWDMDESLDQNKLYEEGETNEEAQRKMRDNLLVRQFWTRLPKSKQVEISTWGILQYEDISLIDDKGDPVNKMVHIYSDFKYEFGPFSQIIHLTGNQVLIENDKNKRISVFPKTYSEYPKGKIHKTKVVKMNNKDIKEIMNRQGINTFYDKNGEYAFLKAGDSIQIENEINPNEKVWVKITCTYSTTINDYDQDNAHINVLYFIKNQLGNEINEKDVINVYEFYQSYNEE